MTVVEVIYLVAATLWIFVVTAALCIGGHYLLKLRARRRRMTGLIDGVRLSVERAIRPYRAMAVGSATIFRRLVGAQLMISSRPSARSAANRSRHSWSAPGESRVQSSTSWMTRSGWLLR